MRHWLKEIRKEMGYTQQQVAERSGISRSFYNQIESPFRRKGLSTQTAKEIGKVLNFHWICFFDEESVNDERYNNSRNRKI